MMAMLAAFLWAAPAVAGGTPTKLLTLGGATLQVPVTLNCTGSLMAQLSNEKQSWDACGQDPNSHFTDTTNKRVWLIERRNEGIAYAAPNLDVILHELRGAPRVRKLKTHTRQSDQSPYLMFERPRWLTCIAPGNEGVYSISVATENAELASLRKQVQAACESLNFKPFVGGIDRPRHRPHYAIERVPKAQNLDFMGAWPGLLKLWDAKHRVQMKLVRWVAKGGSPYNAPRYDIGNRLAPQTYLAGRLRRQGCALKKMAKQRFGYRSGWLVHCLVRAQRGKKGKERVLAFLSSGEEVYLITWHGGAHSWAQLEAAAHDVMQGAWVLSGP